MDRRSFLAAAAAAPFASGQYVNRREKPNIVVILADDLGFADIGCYGSEVQTPNLDAMAQRGVRFTQFYNTARCCPTRASLLTGLYSHQAGVGHMVADWHRPGYRGTLAPDTATVAECLRDAGYGCYASGKWHVATEKNRENLPLQRGFEDFFGTLAGGGNYFFPNQLMRGNEFIKPPEEGFYYTDAIADHAVEFIGKHRNSKPRDPFFLYVAFTAPHWPLHAIEADIAKYRSVYKEGWDEVRAQRHRRQTELGIVNGEWPLSPRDPSVPAWREAPNKDWEVERMAVYAAQIDRMDQCVGRIVKELPPHTLVIFLADNGSSAELIADTPQRWRHTPWTVKGGNDPSIRPGPRDTFQSCGPAWAQVSNAPLRRYKMSVHEGGISTPCIAMWHGVVRKPGSLVNTPGHVIDILPTCLEAANGAPYPKDKQPYEGRSILPGIAGTPLKPHDRLFWEHEGNQAVREGRFKLVRAHGQPWELYDIESDRTEMKDLSAERRTTVSRLAREYDNWMRRANVLPWDEARPA